MVRFFLEDRSGTESFGHAVSEENNGWMRVVHIEDNANVFFQRPEWIPAVGEEGGHHAFRNFNRTGYRIASVHPMHIKHSGKNKTHNLWALFNKVSFNQNEPREIKANCSHQKNSLLK